MKTRMQGLVLCSLLLVAGLAPLDLHGMAPVGITHAQSPSALQAPWWPSEAWNRDPSRFQEGWNLRIPITVEAARDRPQWTPVQVHVDLARAAVEGGWPQIGGHPISFAAYPESVRLVEYTQDWSRVQGDVAVLVHSTWLDPVQEHKTQTGPFHERRNALITLEWRLPHAITAGETQYYIAYFDVVQNAGADGEHRKSAPNYGRADRERLDALYWVGAGSTLHGYYPHEGVRAPRLMIVATEEMTTVEVFTYRGSSTARLDQRQGGPEPRFTLNAGEMNLYPLGTQPTHFLVQADKPVNVLTYALASNPQGGRATHVPEFIPSREGGVAGWTFDVPRVARGVSVLVPVNSPPTQLIFSGFQEAGNPTVPPNSQRDQSVQRTIGLDNTELNGMEMPLLIRVAEGGGPVLVQFTPAGSSFHPAQAASVFGSPVGSTFYSATRTMHAGGFSMTSWNFDEPARVRVRDQTTDLFAEALEVFPPPAEPRRVSGQALADQPYRVYTENEAEIQLRAGQFGASPISQTTPFGGRHGMEFHVQGPFVVYSYYPDTRLDLEHHWDGRRTEVRTIGPMGGLLEFRLENSNQLVSLQANKPVSVFPLGTPINYARFHAAKPDFLHATAHVGEYRGYLFDVRPRDGVDPIFLDGLPGQTLDVVLEVRNLGRWIGGTPLADTLRFDAAVDVTSADAWDGHVPIRFQSPSMRLADDLSHSNRVQIELPADIPPDGTQLRITLRVSSEGNSQMTQELTILVLVRQTFDVNMWFGPPGSVAGPTLHVARIPHGDEMMVPFVVRNAGSGQDSFILDFPRPAGGWDAWITDMQQRPLAITGNLAPGERLNALLNIRAPLTPQEPLALQVDAVSERSPNVGTRITLDARVDLEQDIELQTDDLVKPIAPGTSQRFVVNLANTGEDGLSVRLNLEATMPKGWSVRLEGIGEDTTVPLGLAQGDRVPLTVVVTAPEDAPAYATVTALLRAEGLGEGTEARDAVALTATVAHSPRLDTLVEELSASPGEAIAFDVMIRNTGNAPTTIDIVALTLPGGWDFEGPSDRLTLATSEDASLSVALVAPVNQPPGIVHLLLEARSGGHGFPFPVTVDVQERRELAWREPQRALSQPGEMITMALRLENRGNVPEHVTLAGEGIWEMHLDPAFEIAAQSIRTIQVQLHVPVDQPQGEEILRVSARSEGGAIAHVDIPVRIEMPQLEVDEIIVTSSHPGRHDVGTVIAVLRNSGEVPVRGVEVRLVADGPDGTIVVFDVVAFDSIGGNGSVLAPLRWAAEGGLRAERVEWSHVTPSGRQDIGTAMVPYETAETVDERRLPLHFGIAIVAWVAAAAITRARGGVWRWFW